MGTDETTEKLLGQGFTMKHWQRQLARTTLPVAMATWSVVACIGCLSGPPKAAAGGASTIVVADSQRDSLWEHAIVVLNRNHFQVARESKLEGIIETEQELAMLIALCKADIRAVNFGWCDDAAIQLLNQRVLQTIRERATD